MSKISQVIYFGEVQIQLWTLFSTPPSWNPVNIHAKPRYNHLSPSRKLFWPLDSNFCDVVMSHIVQNIPSYLLWGSSNPTLNSVHNPPLLESNWHTRKAKKKPLISVKKIVLASRFKFFMLLTVLTPIFHVIQICDRTSPSFDSAIWFWLYLSCS